MKNHEWNKYKLMWFSELTKLSLVGDGVKISVTNETFLNLSCHVCENYEGNNE